MVYLAIFISALR